MVKIIIVTRNIQWFILIYSFDIIKYLMPIVTPRYAKMFYLKMFLLINVWSRKLKVNPETKKVNTETIQHYKRL